MAVLLTSSLGPNLTCGLIFAAGLGIDLGLSDCGTMDRGGCDAGRFFFPGTMLEGPASQDGAMKPCFGGTANPENLLAVSGELEADAWPGAPPPETTAPRKFIALGLR